jgi:hypothetical protein
MADQASVDKLGKEIEEFILSCGQHDETQKMIRLGGFAGQALYLGLSFLASIAESQRVLAEDAKLNIDMVNEARGDAEPEQPRDQFEIL